MEGTESSKSENQRRDIIESRPRMTQRFSPAQGLEQSKRLWTCFWVEWANPRTRGRVGERGVRGVYGVYGA